MSILFIILGSALIYMAAFRKSQSKSSKQFLNQTMTDMAGKPIGETMSGAVKYGFRVYLKMIMIAGGIGMILMGLIGLLLF